MLIDWFTVCAQALNFLILVWLLQRFLYRPVLAAIDAREQKSAAMMQEAQAQQSKVKSEGEELHRRSEEFAREQEGRMHTATAAGAAEGQRLIESARRDADVLRVNLAQVLGAERVELGRQLVVRTQREVFALTRKALAELAGTSLADRMIEVFIERLRALPEPQRLALAGAPPDTNAGPATGKAALAQVALLRSADESSAAGRTKLEAAIRERFGAAVVVRFETAPELVCGLELSMAGLKVAWSVADYLSTMAEDAAVIAATALAVSAEAPALAH